MVRQTQIHSKSNFRILGSEGAQKLRTYITKKTLKNFQFLTFGLGVTAVSVKVTFWKNRDFHPFFTLLLSKISDQNY